MKNTALVPYTDPSLAEALASLGAAVRRIADAWRRLAAAIAETLTPVIRTAAPLIADLTGDWADVQLRAVATGREWHLMKHARRARTRKKYRNRLLREAGTDQAYPQAVSARLGGLPGLRPLHSMAQRAQRSRRKVEPAGRPKAVHHMHILALARLYAPLQGTEVRSRDAARRFLRRMGAPSMTPADERIAAWLSQYVRAQTPSALIPASPAWIRLSLALLIKRGVMTAGEARLECAREYGAIIPREYFPEEKGEGT